MGAVSACFLAAFCASVIVDLSTVLSCRRSESAARPERSGARCPGLASASDRDGDFASGVAALEIAQCLGDFGERVGPVDDGCDLFGLYELG